MFELGKEAKIPDLWCMSALVDHVGLGGMMPGGSEGADDEVGRDWRKLREPEGEGGVLHIQQGRTNTRT